VWICEAELRPNELQDLAEVIGDLKAAAVGLNLKLLMRIELGGDPPPSKETIEKFNSILSKACKGLLLQWF